MGYAEELRAVALEGGWAPPDVLHAMPLVFWTFFDGATVATLADEDPAVGRLLAGFIEKIGPVESPEDLEKKVTAYYDANPVDTGLWAALERAFRTRATEGVKMAPVSAPSNEAPPSLSDIARMRRRRR